MPFASEPETSEKAVKRTKSMLSAGICADGDHERSPMHTLLYCNLL